MFKRFRVLIHGENFKLLMDGVAESMCFVTTRFIDAIDVHDAEKKAIIRIFREFAASFICLNTVDDAPRLYVIEVSRERWMRSRLRRQDGYTFYKVTDESKV